LFLFPLTIMAIAKDIRRLPIAKTSLLLVLLGLLIFGAGPGYWRGGHWDWQHLPPVTHAGVLHQMREQGVVIPGWQGVEQQKVRIGGETWSAQTLKAETGEGRQVGQQVFLLLRPQVDARSQPQVEWTDMKGFNRWIEDSEREVSLSAGSSLVKARLLRGWSQGKDTFAVLEWYAWPGGGSPAPTDWFWKDRAAQWQRERLPWVAVTILVPMEPLGDVEKVLPMVEKLGGDVQRVLDRQLG
jgi:cyanoexosortase B-associated protein